MWKVWQIHAQGPSHHSICSFGRECVCKYFLSQTNKCFITIKFKYDNWNECSQPDLLVCITNNTNSLSTPSASSSPLTLPAKITLTSPWLAAAISASKSHNINTNLIRQYIRKSERFPAELSQLQQTPVDSNRTATHLQSSTSELTQQSAIHSSIESSKQHQHNYSCNSSHSCNMNNNYILNDFTI